MSNLISCSPSPQPGWGARTKLSVARRWPRLGRPDLLNIAFVAAAGDAIFSSLAWLFAIGAAVTGWSA